MVTLAEAKDQVRVDVDYLGEDNLLLDLISSAEAVVLRLASVSIEEEFDEQELCIAKRATLLLVDHYYTGGQLDETPAGVVSLCRLIQRFGR